MPVKWSEDGFPYMTQGEEVVPMVLKRKGVTRGEKVTFGNFEETDNFDNTALGMQWMTLRAPATDLYSLSETLGYLTLKCTERSTTEKDTPAFVCRRMQHHRFERTTRMLFNPKDDKEAAGLLLFKDEKHQYFLCVSRPDGKKRISLIKIGVPAEQELASCDLAADVKDFSLKVVSRGTHYDFYYALEGSRDWTPLCKDIDAGYLSTATAGGFTGSTIGLYATRR